MAPELLCGDAEKLNNPWALDVYRCARINMHFCTYSLHRLARLWQLTRSSTPWV